MTLLAAWVQRHETLQQLVVCSDSRVSGGESWNVYPKVLVLPRPGAVIAWSGLAAEATPFVMQAINTCILHDGNLSGRADIGYVAKKIHAVYSDLRRHITDLPVGQENPDVPEIDVMLCGWSWRRLRFEGYAYQYDSFGTLNMRRLDRLDEDARYGVHFLGDAGKVAKRRLDEVLRERGMYPPARDCFDAAKEAKGSFLNWEPLEVMLELISDPEVRTVGGVPQISCIYQRGESEIFVWRDEEGISHFGGRPIPSNERFDRRIIRSSGAGFSVSFSDQSMSAAKIEGSADTFDLSQKP
ncbi:hypothetical protein [Actinokineospora cianjurensis]|uniref:Uncharacterized protein n=1 Tax=Actinokineospora cianjurensis TaxID=585224 RepID=A0A421B7E9_9PSEU|nr:hypothetical protein [Actinokineospora cianjurensis]RLK60412.1 hypothetical protein CLV68_0916 [Actinokineospora cianjurensis]